MSDAATGAMTKFGPGPRASASAGLVLLYAEQFVALPTVHPLKRARNVIGREPPADILVPVNAVSRTHAEIVWEKGGFTLRDLESTNGTLVDGHRVTEV